MQPHLQDQRLLFRLLKQKFIELLRRNSEEGRREALGALLALPRTPFNGPHPALPLLLHIET